MLTDYLLCLFATEPRRYQAIYYTLVGKRTTSNLYAGLAYGLLKWLQIYPNLELAQFQAELTQLQEKGWLMVEDRQAWLTPAGADQKATLMTTLEWPTHYYGPEMGHLQQFQSRLFLAIQIMSEYSHHNTHYFPIETSMRDRVQVVSWFKQHKQDSEMVTQFKQELQLILTQLTPVQADLLANRLVGHQIIGQSQQQLAQKLTITPLIVTIRLLDAQAHFFAILSQHTIDYPLLAGLLSPLDAILSLSTAQTWMLLQQGQSIETISQKRRVKLGTIREHILETAILQPQFPFERFISPDLETALAALMTEMPDLTFNAAHEQLPTLDFFSYRLYQIKTKVVAA